MYTETLYEQQCRHANSGPSIVHRNALCTLKHCMNSNVNELIQGCYKRMKAIRTWKRGNHSNVDELIQSHCAYMNAVCTWETRCLQQRRPAHSGPLYARCEASRFALQRRTIHEINTVHSEKNENLWLQIACACACVCTCVDAGVHLCVCACVRACTYLLCKMVRACTSPYA